MIYITASYRQPKHFRQLFVANIKTQPNHSTAKLERQIIFKPFFLHCGASDALCPKLPSLIRRPKTHRKRKARTPPMSSPVSQTRRTPEPNPTVSDLERDLAFTQDQLATILVMLESLRTAYSSRSPSPSSMPRTSRLEDVDRELLTAYDDIMTQVNHLEKRIATLESRLEEARTETVKMEFDVKPEINYLDEFNWSFDSV
ncbi:hypothetical protein BC936DRAFT_143657 [Jimgerdemannia flammicorona]|uniref:Uncharacterized protein n=1 Tax=Jimgerdemannia flammicorona TaxID=994334 RepID=A0A433DDM9_9FUNG|nr:hypothetical protein BC936DRAFT_143657 [Jimgerdemannia flammicorona]